MKATLLLVDDNLADLTVLYDHLDASDYHVLATDNGIDAVEQTAHAQPDIILLDVRMPGMDGYETCRAIKANPEVADIPIIFLSSLTDVDERVKGFEVGGVDYVTKPIEIQEVMARIDLHLTLARLRQALQATNEHLEETVAIRTVALQAEIEQRKRQQAEKEQLLRLLREQNQQLYSFTNDLLRAKPIVRMELIRIINNRLLNSLTTIEVDLQFSIRALVEAGLASQPYFGRIQAARIRAEQLQTYLTSLITDSADSADTTQHDNTPTRLATLTKREREVLRLLCNGLTPADVGQQLDLSDITVRTYRTRIMRKLDIYHLPGLVKFALRHNLTTLD